MRHPFFNICTIFFGKLPGPALRFSKIEFTTLLQEVGKHSASKEVPFIFVQPPGKGKLTHFLILEVTCVGMNYKYPLDLFLCLNFRPFTQFSGSPPNISILELSHFHLELVVGGCDGVNLPDWMWKQTKYFPEEAPLHFEESHMHTNSWKNNEI